MTWHPLPFLLNIKKSWVMHGNGVFGDVDVFCRIA